MGQGDGENPQQEGVLYGFAYLTKFVKTCTCVFSGFRYQGVEWISRARTPV